MQQTPVHLMTAAVRLRQAFLQYNWKLRVCHMLLIPVCFFLFPEAPPHEYVQCVIFFFDFFF